jgi:hypothetical protein
MLTFHVICKWKPAEVSLTHTLCLPLPCCRKVCIPESGNSMSELRIYITLKQNCSAHMCTALVIIHSLFITVTFLGCVTIRRGMDWILDLLITYTHYSELRAITAPSLIYTLYSSPQRPLSPFQPAVSSPAVPWQRLLTVEILQLPAFMSLLHQHLYRTAFQLSPLECSIQFSAVTANYVIDISSQLFRKTANSRHCPNYLRPPILN